MSSLRIGFDVNELADRHPSGVGRYVANLFAALRTIGADIHPLARASRWTKRQRFIANGIADPSWVAHPLWPIRRFDLVHLTTGRYMPVPRSRRVVATVHDLWEFNEFAAGRIPALTNACFRQVETLRHADAIVCPSRYTANDLRRLFPEFRGQVAITPLGVSDRFRPAPETQVTALRNKLQMGDGEYLLYVGHFHQRKNVPGLVRGYAGLGRQAPPLFLAGNTDIDAAAQIERLVQELGLTNRVRQLGYVAEEDLPALICGSRLVVFTPLFEGFGLPLVEAYRCGTPVVTSNTSSLPELAHPSTPLVEPTDPSSICDGVIRGLAQPRTNELTQALIGHGSDFTWKRCAEQTMALYRQACS